MVHIIKTGDNMQFKTKTKIEGKEIELIQEDPGYGKVREAIKKSIKTKEIKGKTVNVIDMIDKEDWQAYFTVTNWPEGFTFEKFMKLKPWTLGEAIRKNAEKILIVDETTKNC